VSEVAIDDGGRRGHASFVAAHVRICRVRFSVRGLPTHSEIKRATDGTHLRQNDASPPQN
jgi:hypothetical protein